MRSLYSSGGRYWFRGGIRPVAFAPWIAGFVVYHWINPSPLDWWLRLTGSVFGDALATRWPWLNASIPAFLVAFGLGVLLFRDISSGAANQRGDDEDRS